MTRNFTDLSGRVAVVIGGTTGLGRAISIGLAEAGADVVPTGRRAEQLEEVCGQVQGLGRRTLACVSDVCARPSLDKLRDQVLEQFGRVDILVNAAGRTVRRPTAEVPEEEWLGIFDTNLTGMLRSCQAFYPALKNAGRGKVINVASLSSFVAFYEVAAYGASKAGVLALTKSLAIEWARDGINVNAVVPGVFPTELNSKLLNGTERGREILARTPMKRFGNAEELAGAVIFLASDSAGFITGESIAVDGGYLASGVNC